MSKKRLTRLWEIGVRARCSTADITSALYGTHHAGWDVDYLLARYHKHYGKPLKIETLYRIYTEDKARDAAREPAQISPSLRARLGALGKALGGRQ